jgi:hypothetical protein
MDKPAGDHFPHVCKIFIVLLGVQLRAKSSCLTADSAARR